MNQITETTSDSEIMDPGSARRMTTREAHQKALHLIGKWAVVERHFEKYYPNNLPVGPCRIGRMWCGYFFLMAHGQSFEEAFQNYERGRLS